MPSILRSIKRRPQTSASPGAASTAAAPPNNSTAPEERGATTSPSDDDDQPTAVIAPADYENYFSDNRRLLKTKPKKGGGAGDAPLKKVPSDSSGPTALIGPADYVNFFENQNRQRKGKVRGSRPGSPTNATKFDDDDMPTALLQLNEVVVRPKTPVKVDRGGGGLSKVKLKTSIAKALSPSMKMKVMEITSEMPTVMLAKDYENFFSKQKQKAYQGKVFPKAAIKALPAALQSDCPTALLGPADYQNLYAANVLHKTNNAPVSEVPPSIMALLKPKETHANRSVRPNQTKPKASPSTTPSPTTTSPERRVSPPSPRPSTNGDIPFDEQQQYYLEEPGFYLDEEVPFPKRVKKKKKTRKKCCCCCCC